MNLEISANVNPKQSLIIIGCGPGSREYLLPAAWSAAQEADVIAGSARLLDLFSDLPAPKTLCPAGSHDAIELLEKLCGQHKQVALLVSGDPGLFSLAAPVHRHFGRERCRVIPGISSVQLAFSRLGLSSVASRIISAHGRNPDICATDLIDVSPIAVLCGTQSAYTWSANLVDELKETHQAWMCMDLGLPEETIFPVMSLELKKQPVRSLSIVMLEHRSVLVNTK
jgi:cobalt-precorrin-7 (C5)-methyltransferase